MNQAVYQAYDSKGQRKYLTNNENKRFLRAITTFTPRERLLCETLFLLGCRVSELIRLTKDDVDLNECVVKIRCLKKRGKEVIRRIPVPKKVAKALLKLVPGEDGRLWPITRVTAWRIVKKAMLKAGIRGIQATAKGLRHAFGVRSAMMKVPLHVIQRWMGHSSPTTTAIYLDVKDDEERKLISRTWMPWLLYLLSTPSVIWFSCNTSLGKCYKRQIQRVFCIG